MPQLGFESWTLETLAWRLAAHEYRAQICKVETKEGIKCKYINSTSIPRKIVFSIFLTKLGWRNMKKKGTFWFGMGLDSTLTIVYYRLISFESRFIGWESLRQREKENRNSYYYLTHKQSLISSSLFPPTM